MIAPARLAAYDILLAISAGRSDVPSAIARARTSLADDRDRALAAEIATGVQRWRAKLDCIIESAVGLERGSQIVLRDRPHEIRGEHGPVDEDGDRNHRCDER